MIIETQITYSIYRKVMYYMNYCRPVMLIILLCSLLLLVLSAVQLLGILPVTDLTYYQLFIGILYIGYTPIRIARAIHKNYYSNLRLQEKLQFEFTPEKIVTKGESFMTEMNWDKLNKIVEITDCFLLFADHKQAHFVPKEHFSPAQLEEFRTMVRNTEVKARLK